jgi:AcrR family transcriptional regulator
MSADRIPEPVGEELPLAGSDLQRRLAGAAIDLFYRQGALATTVREITEACGLTPGALYNHFSSKEELLYVLVRDIHLRLETIVEQAVMPVAGDPVSELAAIVEVYVARHSHHRTTSRVGNREYRLLTGEWYDEIVAIRRRLRDRLTDVLVAGQRAGLFRLVGDNGGTSANVTAMTILDMCIHISEWFHDRKPLSFVELQGLYVEMALRLAGAPNGADRRRAQS